MNSSSRRAASLSHCVRLLVCAMLFTTNTAVAQRAPREHEVKAAFIFKFGEYVVWPASAAPAAAQPLRIGVLEADAVASELRETYSGRRVNGRPVVLVNAASAVDLGGVHILYIGSDASPAMRMKAAELRRKSVLVITDHPEGLQKGSVINFVTMEGRVRFEISLAAANEAKLELSSRLLAVALRVMKGGLDDGETLLSSIDSPPNAAGHRRDACTVQRETTS